MRKLDPSTGTVRKTNKGPQYHSAPKDSGLKEISIKEESVLTLQQVREEIAAWVPLLRESLESYINARVDEQLQNYQGKVKVTPLHKRKKKSREE